MHVTSHLMLQRERGHRYYRLCIHVYVYVYIYIHIHTFMYSYVMELIVLPIRIGALAQPTCWFYLLDASDRLNQTLRLLENNQQLCVIMWHENKHTSLQRYVYICNVRIHIHMFTHIQRDICLHFVFC